MIKNLALADHPREKAENQGLKSLTDTELLALFLRTGVKNKSALVVAQELIEIIGGLDKILNLKIHNLTKIQGIGKAKALEILAVIELEKRIRIAQVNKQNFIINKPEAVYKLLWNDFRYLKHEIFLVVLLDKKNQLIKKKKLYDGTSDELLIDTKDIYKFVLENNADKFVCVHNHPSGNPKPSKNDLKTTKKITEIGLKINTLMLDHIIFGKNKIFSILLNQEFLMKKID